MEMLDSEGGLWQSQQGRLIHPVPSIPTKRQVRGNSRDRFIHCGPIGKKNEETQYHPVCLPGANRGLRLDREQRACIINSLGQGLVSVMVLAAKSVLKSCLITCETSPPPRKFLLLALGHQTFPFTISRGNLNSLESIISIVLRHDGGIRSSRMASSAQQVAGQPELQETPSYLIN